MALTQGRRESARRSLWAALPGLTHTIKRPGQVGSVVSNSTRAGENSPSSVGMSVVTAPRVGFARSCARRSVTSVRILPVYSARGNPLIFKDRLQRGGTASDRGPINPSTSLKGGDEAFPRDAVSPLSCRFRLFPHELWTGKIRPEPPLVKEVRPRCSALAVEQHQSP